MSLPHIVGVVTRTQASAGPISGIGFSRSSIRSRSTNTAAFIVFDVIFRLSFGCLLAFGTAGLWGQCGKQLLLAEEGVRECRRVELGRVHRFPAFSRRRIFD